MWALRLRLNYMNKTKTTKLDQHGFHPVLVAFVLVALVAVAFAGYRVMKNGHNVARDNGQTSSTPSSKTSNIPNFADQYASTCKTRDVSFTSPPIPFDQL